MSVRFLLGRAGTGKTHFCEKEISDQLRENPDGEPLIMLVPDQMTFETEYRLATSEGIEGMTRAEVFSFGRLALNVLQQAGGVTRQKIDNVGINMLLRRIVEARKDDLKVFQRASDQQGFYELLEQMMTELKRYRFSAPQWAAVMESFQLDTVGNNKTVLIEKLHDLSLIYSDLEALLSGKYIDSEDTMQMLSEKITQVSSFRKAKIWVDGFYSFNPQEQMVLLALMKHCKQVTISLTMDRPYDSQLPDESNLFYLPALSYQKILGLAKESGVEVDHPLILQETKRFSNHVLAQLEARFDSSTMASPISEEAIVLSQAVNRRSEVEAAAREILRLAREDGIRYRDVAVLVRDLTNYHDLLATVFEDHDIPIFLDQKRTMLHHPLMEFVRSSLDVIDQNWRYEAVFRCVKTDLLFGSDQSGLFRLREDMDELENYVLAHGIRGKRWTDGKRWVYRRYRGLDDMNLPQTDSEKEKESRFEELRNLIVTPLERLERDMKKAKSARQYCKALFLFLETLDVPVIIEKWRDEAEADGRLAEAREHDQVWSAIIGLLDQMVEMNGDEPIGFNVFMKMIETGLDSMRFSLVPPAVDQVLVGSLDRTRSVNVKSVLILGANDGIMPAKQSEEGMLSEEERSLLEKKGIELAPGSKQRLLEEEFLIYLAFSGARDRLWISYSLADEEGKALQPSIMINRLKKWFPDLKERLLTAEPEEAVDLSALSFVTAPRRALVYVLGQVRQWKKGYPISNVWWDVYNWLTEQTEWQPDGKRLFGGIFYNNKEKPLHKKTSEQLYGDSIQASVSRMERFSSCPFQHFAHHGLRLRDREIFRLEAPDVGQLFHTALHLIVDHLRSTNKEWGELSDADCQQLAAVFVDQLIPKLQREVLLSSNRHQYIAYKLKNVVGRTTTVLRDHARSSGFAPIGLEVPFGPKSDLPPISFQLTNGTKMEIVGRIDRVDAAKRNEGLLLRVIDYKSGDQSLNLSDVYFGLSLQMLTYLDVLLTNSKKWLGKNSDPAGVLYFHVHDPILNEKVDLSEAEIEKKLFKQFKMKGLVLADDEAVRLMDQSLDSGVSSDIIPVGLKKDGSFNSRSSVIRSDQFSDVRQFVRGTIQRIGDELTDGKIEISPYRVKDRTPCTFCSFKPVCQFDPSTESNEYRWLRKEKDEDILKRMTERGLNNGDCT